MKFSIEAVTPLSYFKSLVGSEKQFPLLEAAASIAQDEEPNLDIQNVLATCDALLVRLKRRVKAEADPMRKLCVCVEELIQGGQLAHRVSLGCDTSLESGQ